MQRKQPSKLEETREASWRPESIDKENRTAEVVWTTGADVMRADPWTGTRYIERLKVDKDAVNLERLISGAAVLDSHDRMSVRNQIGVVESARIEDGEGVAVVRFSERADDIFRDVADGIIRKVSVGYVQDERAITENEDGPDIHEITRWTPYELSFVTVPADNGAQVRSIEKETDEMEKDEQTRDAAAPIEAGAASSEPNVIHIADPEASQKGAKAERERLLYIAENCDRLGIPAEMKRELIDTGISQADAAQRILVYMANKPGHVEELDHRIEPGDGKREADFAGVLTRAIEAKTNPETAKDLDGDARVYAHLRCEEQMRLAMEADGNHSARNLSGALLADAIIKHIHTRAAVDTSVLTSVNANISSRALLRGYNAVRRTFIGIFRQETVVNYQNNERVALSDAPVLPAVLEGASYTEVQLSDRKEVWAIAKYGHIIRLTRKMIVNDDLSAFSRLAQMRGAAAARTENQIVWAILTANDNLSDAAPIFGAGTGTRAQRPPASAQPRSTRRVLR